MKEVEIALENNMYPNLIKLWIDEFDMMVDVVGNCSILRRIREQLCIDKPTEKGTVLDVEYKDGYSIQLEVVNIGIWGKTRYNYIDQCPYFRLEYLGVCG